jgi:class 3 adenylate cyclase/energy-converting hydrogenase Eha subunit E
MNADAARMNRLTLRFADANLEASFAEEQARKSLRPIRIALLFAGAFFLISSPGLVKLAPYVREEVPRMLAVALTTIGICYAFTYAQIFLRRHQWMMLALVSVMSVGMIRVTAAYSPQMLAASGFLFMVLHLFSIYGAFRLRFPAAVAGGWIGMGMYLGFLSVAGLLPESALPRHSAVLVVANLLGMLICYQMDLALRRAFLALREVAEERERSERLLLNILPALIAERLKASEDAIAEHSDGVTVLFADIVDFTPLSARKTPQELVELLNRIFSGFDALADAHGLEKIKTIGDAYMAVAGLPKSWPDHAPRAARMALAMLDATARVAAETGEKLALRIGLHSGPVVAGVIGRRKFTYDLWGDTVNTASRMESHGVPGSIHCSEATATLLRGAFQLQARGAMEIKGKGEMRTFLVLNLEGIPN